MRKVKCVILLLMLLLVPSVFGEMANPNITFTRVSPPALDNTVEFSVDISTLSLSDFDGATIAFGMIRQGDDNPNFNFDENTFYINFSEDWEEKFGGSYLTTNNQISLIYQADLVVEAYAGRSVGSTTLSLGNIVVCTAGLPEGNYTLQVDSDFDGSFSMIYLTSSTQGPDPVFGSVDFTVVPEPMSLLLFLGAGILGLRPKKVYP